MKGVKMSVALSSKKIILIVMCVILALIAGFAAWAFLWPSRSAELQKADIKRRDYNQSVADIQKVIADDTANSQVRPDCRPILKTHGKKTARAVMILHGVSAEPSGMVELADWFYQAGYNVYVPRVPHHGMKDNKLHGQVPRQRIGEIHGRQCRASQRSGRRTGRDWPFWRRHAGNLVGAIWRWIILAGITALAVL